MSSKASSFRKLQCTCCVCQLHHHPLSFEDISGFNIYIFEQIVLLACVALAVADVSHLDTVVRFDSVVNPDSYQYAYETSKGIKAEESGNLKNAGSENESIVSLLCGSDSEFFLKILIPKNRMLRDLSATFHPKERTSLFHTLLMKTVSNQLVTIFLNHHQSQNLSKKLLSTSLPTHQLPESKLSLFPHPSFPNNTMKSSKLDL